VPFRFVFTSHVRQTAVHDEFRAGNTGGGIAGEEQNCFGDLAGFTKTPQLDFFAWRLLTIGWRDLALV
jgi:hypothetical protein